VVRLLEAHGLEHEDPGPVRAVDGIDLSLEVGEFVVAIGPNGSGKTSLLRLLGGLLPGGRGEVLLAGRALERLSARERARRIAFVPQALFALPDVTVLDFVLSGRYGHLGLWKRLAGADLEVARQALADADAVEFADRLLDELSAGQRQRVLIARALAQEADLLLVDEPTNSLDPEHQILVFSLLARLSCEGRGVLVVTHDLNLASQFATRLLLLDAGRVVASGDARAVLRREVLEPVYGPHLRYGSWPGAQPGEDRPFVVPWLAAGRAQIVP
jgi:iron complex transport system ATP-binding protein